MSEVEANEHQQLGAPEHHDVAHLGETGAGAYQERGGPEPDEDADQLTGPADRQPFGGTPVIGPDEPAEPDAPEPDLSVPTTGDARVDDALGRLGDLTGLPVAEHLPVYEDVQRRLHDALADLDER